MDAQKVYVVLSVGDLRRMINHIKATSKPHAKGNKKDFSPCTGVFRSTLGKHNGDEEYQIESYQFTRQ